MISFVVPAYNEEALLGGTLEALHEAGRAMGAAFEIVVADDASTDGTAAMAREHGARVVSVRHRQIAATRNSGARAASGTSGRKLRAYSAGEVLGFFARLAFAGLKAVRRREGLEIWYGERRADPDRPRRLAANSADRRARDRHAACDSAVCP